MDWNQPAKDVACTIRASDSRPGAPGTISGNKYLLYGATVESQGGRLTNIQTAKPLEPGKLIGRRNGAVLAACGKDTAIWISHMKKPNCRIQKHIKLPAEMVLGKDVTSTLPGIPEPPLYLLPAHFSRNLRMGAQR